MRRVGLVTLLALGAVAVAGSVTAGLVGVHAHGYEGLVWDLGAVLPLLLIGAYAYLSRPEHPTTQRMAVLGALFALETAFAPPVGITPEGVTIPSDVVTFGREQLWIAYFGFQVINLAMLVTVTRLLALYPDGHMETRAERRLLRPLWWLLALPVAVLVAFPTLVPPSYESATGPPSPFVVQWLEPVGVVAAGALRTAEALPLLGIGLLVARYRRSAIETRQRIKWLLVPLSIVAMVILADVVAADLFLGSLFDMLFVPVVPAFGLSLLLGLRQQRIVTIDIVLRRSLVYGLLWVLIAGAYVGIAALLGLAVSERFPVTVALLLTIGVTLAFQPARRWLEGLADHWVFGARVGRYEALTNLGRLLEGAFDLEELLPKLAGTVKEALGVEWVRVELAGEPGAESAAAASGGEPGAAQPVLEVPIELADERLGTLLCGPKVRGPLGEPDRAVLADLARQAALGIRNVRLARQLAARVEQLRERTAELAESRIRLLRAQESERRRIERDLHDGIQQDLVALIGEVGRTRSQLDGVNSAGPALGEIQVELTRVLNELRELAQGIHPQVLTDGGLVPAIQARARRCPLQVEVRAAPRVRSERFVEEVEGAVYFTVCEALANVLKHADANRVDIRLDRDHGNLLVDVTDNGLGLADGAAETGTGSGLSNLGERLAALEGSLTVGPGDHGGTTVHAEVPIGVGVAP